MLACFEEILKEEKRSLCRQTSVLDFLKSSEGTRTAPCVALDVGEDDPGDLPAVQEVLLL